MSLSRIVERIRREAELQDNPGVAALMAARYYGFNSRVVRMIQLWVDPDSEVETFRYTCEELLSNPEGNLHSPFFRALANYHLGCLPVEVEKHKPTREQYLAQALGCLGTAGEVGHEEDADYVARLVKMAELEQPEKVAVGFYRLEGLTYELIKAGDFAAPQAVVKLIEQANLNWEGKEEKMLVNRLMDMLARRQMRPDCYFSAKGLKLVDQAHVNFCSVRKVQ